MAGVRGFPRVSYLIKLEKEYSILKRLVRTKITEWMTPGKRKDSSINRVYCSSSTLPWNQVIHLRRDRVMERMCPLLSLL